jgi:hypothetical protein
MEAHQRLEDGKDCYNFFVLVADFIVWLLLKRPGSPAFIGADFCRYVLKLDHNFNLFLKG